MSQSSLEGPSSLREVSRLGICRFRVQGFRALGVSGFGFRGLGFEGFGFRGLGFRGFRGF